MARILRRDGGLFQACAALPFRKPRSTIAARKATKPKPKSMPPSAVGLETGIPPMSSCVKPMPAVCAKFARMPGAN